ncbi:MAG: hypothetical protein KUG77_29175 [Nannocystaceae bacterium]|nr:hypothetical protein [Nannocystaceae bacterium]
MTEAPGIVMEADTDTDGDGDGVIEHPDYDDINCYVDDDNSHENGVVQWCNGEYEFDLDFTFNSLAGGNSPYSYSYSSTIQLVKDSTYDKPLVAACCTDVTDVPGSVKAFATSSVGLDVSGPIWNGEVISGIADASSESWVGFREGATDLTLDGWSMVEDGSTNIGTSTVSSKVRKFEVRLVGQHVAPDEGRYFVLAKNEALFALGGVVEDESDYITTKNSSPIEFYIRRPGSKGCPSTTESCLVNKPFRLTYEDMLGQTWEVDVASTTWAP